MADNINSKNRHVAVKQLPGIAKEKVEKILKDIFSTEDIFWNNEIKSNLLVAFALELCAVILVLVWVMNYLGLFSVPQKYMTPTVAWGLVELIVPAVICRVLKGSKKWLKYVLLIEYIIVLARMDSVLTYNATLIMILPIVLSCRYFNDKFTLQIGIVTVVLFGLSAFFGTFLGSGMLDVNIYNPPVGSVIVIKDKLWMAIEELGVDRLDYALTYMKQSFLPKLLIYAIVLVISMRVAQTGKKMVLDQAAVSAKTARIESELNLATDIQANMLPNIFPAFPDNNEFDIYATMQPAKEVGGDLYDFFMIDDKHVAVVIADVSGKGVPAALFMVVSKTIIKNYAQMSLEPADVFTKVNSVLCENNKAGLFVTGWLGILNIETGKLIYANAGHNPPLLMQSGSFEYMKSRPGFVLAGIEGYTYKQSEIEIKPGDRLFLYTDGVTEATSAEQELYGETRLQEYLNEHLDDNLVDTLKGVRADIDGFVGEAEQFDDITMLVLEFKKYKKPNE